jgi:hypothetical protein
VGRAVHAEELLVICRRRLHQLEAEPVTLRKRLLDGGQPPGVLGVSTGVVLAGARVSDVEARDLSTVIGLDGATPQAT